MSEKTRMESRCLSLLFALILISILPLSPSLAQPENPPGKLIFTDDDLLVVGGWTDDEKYVRIWRSTNLKSEYMEVATGNLIESVPSSPPVQLTAAELAAFGIDPQSADSLSRHYTISPDGNYVAYKVPSANENTGFPGCPPYQLRLANRHTRVSIDLPFVFGIPIYFDWLSNSKGLLIGTGGGCDGPDGSGFVAFVSNVSPSLMGLRILQDIPLLQTDLGELQVSKDGQWLLASSAPNFPLTGGDGIRLILVNVADPSRSKILTDNIAGFLHAELLYENTTMSILMISATGLIELSLTGQQKILDARLNSTGAGWCSEGNYVMSASASPSGRWLAYLHCADDLGISLYLLDLNALRHPGSPTLSLAPTITPIGN